MKRIIILFLAATASLGLRAQSPEQLWDNANTSYINGEYQLAIERYDSLLATGNVSPKVYYNLGNAYFKENRIGKAILNYNRALRLAPSDSDIKYNLRIANARTVDKIDKVPEFFAKTWINSLRMGFNSNTWAVVSLMLFALSLGAVLLYLLSSKTAVRKVGFYSCIVLIVMFIMAGSFSMTEKRELTDSSQAIIMQSSVSVKSSPDNASKDIFILHEGTKVTVLRSLNYWSEIMIDSGNKGWVPEQAIETI